MMGGADSEALDCLLAIGDYFDEQEERRVLPGCKSLLIMNIH